MALAEFNYLQVLFMLHKFCSFISQNCYNLCTFLIDRILAQEASAENRDDPRQQEN